MRRNDLWKNPNLIKILKEDGVAVMPTDTLYGIVGRAQSASVVNRIYKVRKRAPNKPCIILIPDVDELEKFGIVLSMEQKKEIKKYQKNQGPTSFVFDCPDERLAYLHRGTKTLAFRLPAVEGLRNLLKETGPLIAPSANPEGLPPAENILQAEKYFGDAVDLYIDGGTRAGRASKVVKLHKDGSMQILRH